MKKFLPFLGVFQLTVIVARLMFDGMNYIPAGTCVYKALPVEKCGDYNLLPQDVSTTLNTIGAALEAGNSMFLLAGIFYWKRFHTKAFFFTIFRVGHFWVWFFLCFTYVISEFVVDLVQTKGDSNGESLTMLGVWLVTEAFLLTFLALALNFIARETYISWINEKLPSRAWQKLFHTLYPLVLFAYLVRNLGMFLYDTALVALSISLIKGGSTAQHGWDSLLLVLNVAFRGSFVKFFFAKMFQGQKLPEVCENITENNFPPQVNGRVYDYRTIDTRAYESSIADSTEYQV